VNVEPVTLEGRHVRLEPVRSDHLDALWEAGDAGAYPELWRYIPFPMRTRDDLRVLIELGAASVAPFRLVFATIDLETGEAVGSTAFLNVDNGNRRLEIGSTWVTPAKQRSPVNTEAKYLQLTHCFDELGCARVEFKTDARNEQSRAALERIGATEEGVLRKHMLMPDGVWRDSVYYSILDTEWPSVRERLHGLLDR
jgi:RimJ/RimL family protein N-acetyltransferase